MIRPTKEGDASDPGWVEQSTEALIPDGGSKPLGYEAVKGALPPAISDVEHAITDLQKTVASIRRQYGDAEVEKILEAMPAHHRAAVESITQESVVPRGEKTWDVYLRLRDELATAHGGISDQVKAIADVVGGLWAAALRYSPDGVAVKRGHSASRQSVREQLEKQKDQAGYDAAAQAQSKGRAILRALVGGSITYSVEDVTEAEIDAVAAEANQVIDAYNQRILAIWPEATPEYLLQGAFGEGPNRWRLGDTVVPFGEYRSTKMADAIAETSTEVISIKRAMASAAAEARAALVGRKEEEPVTDGALRKLVSKKTAEILDGLKSANEFFNSEAGHWAYDSGGGLGKASRSFERGVQLLHEVAAALPEGSAIRDDLETAALTAPDAWRDSSPSASHGYNRFGHAGAVSAVRSALLVARAALEAVAPTTPAGVDLRIS